MANRAGVSVAAAAAVLALVLCGVCAQEGKRALVVFDDLAQQHQMGNFLADLEKRGYALTVSSAADMPPLDHYGVWQFDKLLYFAPEYDGQRLNAPAVARFIDEGNDLVLGASPAASNLMRAIAASVGVEFDAPRSVVLDHFNYDTKRDDGQHTTVAATNVIDSKSILGGQLKEPVLFRGIGASLNIDNTLVFPVLSGFSSTYSFAPMQEVGDGELKVAGTKTVLVAALQARNNARVLVSGSVDLFSDAFSTGAVVSSAGQKSANSGNEQFVREVTKWTFQERGVLRLTDVRHRKAGEQEPPEVYTVEEDIDYSLKIEELVGNKWVPFIADDVQMEFVMLDPYWRITLKPNADGLYQARFKAPDAYGIFQFKVDYHRLGYTGLSDSQTMVVRPFRHDEYERFIPAAFPYYASAFSMIGSVVLFSVLYLFHNEHK